ncbi:hypothetical protein BGZ46_009148 [Entomortierella lignicola]|nr:hypothetical protein BGZ46_009148 [Entomortierella lignicola]
MSQNVPVDNPRPQVLIIGAGIGGLILAMLLEQVDIPYHIFERASEVKQLGSAMALTAGTFPALEQIGVYNELVKVSKPYDAVRFFNGKNKEIGTFDADGLTATGYANRIFARPKFYDILRSRVPDHRISFKKKVLRTEEKDGKVIIHCSDNTTYTGDILVGADGAYSAVRQNMYKQMDEKGIIPKSDMEEFSISYITMVGVATPPNLEKYPQFKDENASFNQVIYGDGANCYVITLPNNQISWGFGIQLSKEAVKEMQFRNSEWGPEKNDSTLAKYRDFPCPLGGTMGDIFDATPKELISKVFLEEKMFKTWHNGRSVLLGDACHKLHPAGGQGGRNAIDDAVALANCIYFMKDSSESSIKSAFQDYYKQRYRLAEEEFNNSSFFSKVLNGQKLSERVIRYLVLKCIPEWLMKLQTKNVHQYRQQVAWLPLIENRGKVPVLPQVFESVVNSRSGSV